MILQTFSVYDSKAKAFLPPFFLHNIDMAKRVFQNCANDDTHTFGTNPGDYTLFHVGAFNDDSGSIEALATPINLGLAQEYKGAEETPNPTMPLDFGAVKQ